MKLTNATAVQSIALPEGKGDKIFFDCQLLLTWPTRPAHML
jgi:hypothetical protein